MKRFDNFKQQAEKLLKDLGRVAEPAFKEIKTTHYITDYLNKNGIPIDRVCTTGCYGTIDCGAEKTIALRADIDALPANPEGTEFKHLCGHHAHTTILLLALKHLAQHKSELKTNIRYIFQPAEEIVRGAEYMIGEGCLVNCSDIYGIHVDPRQKTGEMLLKAGELMAGVMTFDLAFKGTNTHAAFPHTGSDVLMAATDYTNLCQKIISRFKDPTKKAVLSFTQISGGQTYNVLPESCQIKGTLRYFDSEIKELTKTKLRDIVTAIKLIYDINIDLNFTHGVDPLHNDAGAIGKLTDIFTPSSLTVNTGLEPMMGGEDFACYLQKLPGAFIHLGIADGVDHPPLHNSEFYVPLEPVLVGTAIWVELATKYPESNLHLTPFHLETAQI